MPQLGMECTSLFLSSAQRQQSIEQALQHWNRREDLWIYAYGSLIWNAGFPVTDRRMATVRGYHRALCLWSRLNRGTLQSPGLVFGLNRGGSCQGVVLRLAAAQVEATFTLLWEREMMMGSYLPRWLRCATPQGELQALAFVIDRRGTGYAGTLADDELLAAIRRAHGRYGACIDYVIDTDTALREHGISDRRLERVVTLLGARR